MTETKNELKLEVKLVGNDGNAFAIIGACKNAWRRHHRTLEGWDEIQEEMMSGDYDHLLQTAMTHFDVS